MMCQEAIGWLPAAVPCLLFGAIGWWIRKQPDLPEPIKNGSGLDKYYDVRVRFFRFFAYPFLVAGVLFGVLTVNEWIKC